jgi:hypothetical protein
LKNVKERSGASKFSGNVKSCLSMEEGAPIISLSRDDASPVTIPSGSRIDARQNR